MQLHSLINHPERLNRDTLYELRAIVARYPYFQTARLLLLNNLYLLHEPDFGLELRRSVLYIADRRALCRLIEGRLEMPEMTLDEPAEQPTVDRTLSLIDAFLDTLPEQGATVPGMVGAVNDYASTYLLDEPDVVEKEEHEELSPDEEKHAVSFTHQGTIDDFLTADNERLTLDKNASSDDASQPQQVPSDMPDEPVDESCFTETLAKIYVKQKKYERALEIIRSLYLKYPEKNIYFADQIRFLEKLIINNNSKK